MEQEKLIALVKKARSGDSSAMEQLLTIAHTTVSYQCRKFMNSPEDAEDMTQEVLLVIYQKLDTLTDPAAFNGWVKRIAATRCMNAVSRAHVELQFAEDEDGNSFIDTIEELDNQKIPDAAMDDAETARMVVELIDALPEAQRICTYLYYYDELSIKEIAELTAATENTVKSRLNYARKAIKEGVLDHEKKGVKLYSLSPLPFLVYFLRMAAQAEANSAAAASCVTGVMAANAATAASVAAATTNAAAAGSTATAAAATTTTTATAVSGKVAGSVARFLSKKLIAGIVAGAVALGGGAVAAVHLVNEFADTVPAVICQHEWEEANCMTPKTCSKCDSVEGEALGHIWNEADCEYPQTCQTCGTTEGNALGHIWEEATCETAKICQTCAAVGGEALGHNMAEANYQQPATCKTCGYTEGEVLTPAAVAYGLHVIDAEMGVEYPYTTTCWENTEYKTVATVTLTGYSVFDAAEGYAPLDGYEWHRATFRVLLDDENAWNYGYSLPYIVSDYYNPGVMNDTPVDGSTTLKVKFNGVVYDQCRRIVESEWSGWDNKTKSCYYDCTFTWRVPVGYDGYLFAMYDSEYVLPMGENPFEHLDPNALIFRFPQTSLIVPDTPSTEVPADSSEPDSKPAEHTHDYTTKTVAPTTEAEGYDEHICSGCGASYRDNYTPKIEEDHTGTYKQLVSASSVRPDGTERPAVWEWIPWDCATQGHRCQGEGSYTSVVQEETCCQPRIIKMTCAVIGCDGYETRETWYANHVGDASLITYEPNEFYAVRGSDGYAWTFSDEASVRAKAKQMADAYRNGESILYVEWITYSGYDVVYPENFVCKTCGQTINYREMKEQGRDCSFTGTHPENPYENRRWEETYTKDNQPDW